MEFPGIPMTPKPPRLPPPGPLGYKRRRSSGARLRGGVEAALATPAAALARRARPLALAAAALALAGIAFALSAGRDGGSPETPVPALGGADLPIEIGEASAPGSSAGTRADATRVRGPGSSYALTLPAGWKRSTGDQGRRYRSAPGRASLLVTVDRDPEVPASAPATRATAALRSSVPRAATLQPAPARSPRGLRAVARASWPGGTGIAYVDPAAPARYLLISRLEADASGAERRQAAAALRSFRPLPGG